MASLHENLKSSQKYGWQYGIKGLPRQFRRRTRSHNRFSHRYRPNKKKHDSHKQDQHASSEQEFKNRRMRRTKKALHALATASTNWKEVPEAGVNGNPKLRRLETHVWHAKRFQMRDFGWGWLLPDSLPGRGRGSRSFISSFKNGAVVHDSSYFCPILLSGALKDVDSCIASMVDPITLSNAYVPGWETSAFLHHHDQFPLKAICPILMQCWQRKQHDIICLVWVHAASSTEAYTAIKNCTTERRLADRLDLDVLNLRRIELRGGNADRALHQALFWEDAKTWKRLQSIDVSQTIMINLMDPRIVKPVVLGSSSAQLRPSTVNNVDDLVDMDRQSPPVDEAEVGRMRHYLRKELVLGLKLHRIPGDQKVVNVDDLEQSIIVPTSQIYCTAIVVRCQHGWSIIIPSGWAKSIWIAFMTVSFCRAAGQREWGWIHALLQLPFFPKEMPDTAAYRHYRLTELKREEDQQSRKPLGKQIESRISISRLELLNEPRLVDGHVIWSPISQEEESKPSISFVIARREEIANQYVFGNSSKIMSSNFGKSANPVLQALKYGKLKWQVASKNNLRNSEFITLAMILLNFVKKGTAAEGAIVYTISHRECEFCKQNMRIDKHLKDPELAGRGNNSAIAENDLVRIGYITSPSLYGGCRTSTSIGLCSVSAFWRLRSLQHDANRRNFGSVFAWLRNPGSPILFPVSLRLLYEVKR